MLPEDVRSAVEEVLNAPVEGGNAVGGGCIANASRIRTERGDFFLKWSRDEVARTFPAEAAGLRALGAAGSPLRVPRAIAARDADSGSPGFLLMDWIDEGSRGRGFWNRFGEGLASLHRHTADEYGFDRDNFIGRLPQQNGCMDTWTAFVRERRLGPQVSMAQRKGRWRRDWDAQLDRLYDRLEEILPAHPPASILHGDLWGGNFLVDGEHRAVLIDPASYYGHREADLAMTELFGGFDPAFYQAYRGAWPLDPGYEERREVYNLYHLINHLNHFGGGYAGSVAGVLRRY